MGVFTCFLCGAIAFIYIGLNYSLTNFKVSNLMIDHFSKKINIMTDPGIENNFY